MITSDAEAVRPQPALQLEDIRKRYGAIPALDGLSLEVSKGEVYGLLGRNGAGKSTALRTAIGISRPDTGKVLLFGTPLARGDTRAKRRIGYVAQEQAFYDWMKAESIGRFVSGFYPNWDQAEYSRLLALLEIPTDRKIRSFSGGTHAKLALALALAHRPDLLVLDEPTAGMDPVARREFIELIRDQAERTHRTTIFSSHLIDEVELAANTVGILHQGHMLYQGSLEALRSRVRCFVHPVDDGKNVVFPAVDEARDPSLQVLQDRVHRGERQLMIMADDGQSLLGLMADGWRGFTPTLADAFVAMVTRHRDI